MRWHRRCAVYVQIGVGFFTGRKNEDSAVLCIQSPAAACSYVAVQKNRLVLRQNADNINAAVCTVAERKINDAVFAAVKKRQVFATFFVSSCRRVPRPPEESLLTYYSASLAIPHFHLLLLLYIFLWRFSMFLCKILMKFHALPERYGNTACI